MDTPQLDTKWWLDSTIVRKALLLLFPVVAQVLKLFNLPFPQETQDTVEAIVTLVIVAYVGITLLIDRFNVSHKKTTVVSPITTDRSEVTK